LRKKNLPIEKMADARSNYGPSKDPKGAKSPLDKLNSAFSEFPEFSEEERKVWKNNLRGLPQLSHMNMASLIAAIKMYKTLYKDEDGNFIIEDEFHPEKIAPILPYKMTGGEIHTISPQRRQQIVRHAEVILSYLLKINDYIRQKDRRDQPDNEYDTGAHRTADADTVEEPEPSAAEAAAAEAAEADDYDDYDDDDS